MGKLDGLLNQLTPEVEEPDDLREALKALTSLSTSAAQDQRIKALENALVSLAEAFTEFKSEPLTQRVGQQLRDLESLVEAHGHRDTDLSGIVASLQAVHQGLEGRIDSLDGTVKDFTNAVGAIKLPTLQVPEYQDPDFTSVISEIQALRDVLPGGQTVVELPDFPKRKWKFDIKRNQSGFMRSVDVEEVTV